MRSFYAAHSLKMTVKNMNSYDYVADFYDKFTKAFDYNDYIKKCFSNLKNKPNGNLVLDCGCGTGNLLEVLADKFDCTGVDISEEMLQRAYEKNTLKKVNFVCQTLDKLDLYGAYDYAFCSLDTINHLTDKKNLKSFFNRIANFIEPNGVFIFDIKTLDTIKNGAKTEIYEEDDTFLIWEGFWQKPYISHKLTFFTPEKNLYKKEETIIEERYYEKEEIKNMMKTLSSLKFEKSFIYKKERTVFIYRKEQ